MRIGIRRQVEKAGRKEFEEYYGGQGAQTRSRHGQDIKNVLNKWIEKREEGWNLATIGMPVGRAADGCVKSCEWLSEELWIVEGRAVDG